MCVFVCALVHTCARVHVFSIIFKNIVYIKQLACIVNISIVFRRFNQTPTELLFLVNTFMSNNQRTVASRQGGVRWTRHHCYDVISTGGEGIECETDFISPQSDTHMHTVGIASAASIIIGLPEMCFQHSHSSTGTDGNACEFQVFGVEVGNTQSIQYKQCFWPSYSQSVIYYGFLYCFCPLTMQTLLYYCRY